MGSVGGLSNNGVNDIVNKLFGKKGKELFDRIPNIPDALKVVNPNYKVDWLLWGKPSDKEGEIEYKKYGWNCALCTTAAALQLMGYDVEAMPYDYATDHWRGYNSVFDVDLSNSKNAIVPEYGWMWPSFLDPYSKDPDKASGKENFFASKNNPNKFGDTSGTATLQIDNFIKDAGPYSFAALTVHWKSGSAHSMLAYRDKYRTYIFDFQSRRTYTGMDDMKKLMDKTIPEHSMLTRLDNAKFRKDMTEAEVSKMVKKRQEG